MLKFRFKTLEHWQTNATNNTDIKSAIDLYSTEYATAHLVAERAKIKRYISQHPDFARLFLTSLDDERKYYLDDITNYETI